MRYFLNIRSGGSVIQDREGAEFQDLEAARREAERSARELLAEVLRQGEILDGRSIEICDEGGRIFETILLRDQFRLMEK